MPLGKHLDDIAKIPTGGLTKRNCWPKWFVRCCCSCGWHSGQDGEKRTYVVSVSQDRVIHWRIYCKGCCYWIEIGLSHLYLTLTQRLDVGKMLPALRNMIVSAVQEANRFTIELSCVMRRIIERNPDKKDASLRECPFMTTKVTSHLARRCKKVPPPSTKWWVLRCNLASANIQQDSILKYNFQAGKEKSEHPEGKETSRGIMVTNEPKLCNDNLRNTKTSFSSDSNLSCGNFSPSNHPWRCCCCMWVGL